MKKYVTPEMTENRFVFADCIAIETDPFIETSDNLGKERYDSSDEENRLHIEKEEAGENGWRNNLW